jgi:hypothetical protein
MNEAIMDVLVSVVILIITFTLVVNYVNKDEK